MITFKQFLKEDSLPQTPEEIAKILRRDCSPYLAEMPACGLWRGFASSIDDVSLQIKTVRKDRIPMSSPKELHYGLDDAFEKYTGIKFRSQAVFATPNNVEASSYGDEFLIFPIGQIDYCWSPEIPDLYMSAGTFPAKNTPLEKFMLEVINDQFPDRDKTQSPADFFDRLGRSGRSLMLVEVVDQNFDKLYKFNSDLRKNNVVKDGCEVMISCDKYYAVEKTIGLEILKMLT